MSGTIPKKRKLDLAFASLDSDEGAVVMDALDRIEAHGDAAAIPHLLRAHVRTTSEAVRQRITGLLHQVKAPNAGQALMAALDDEDLSAARPIILSSVWNAGLDVRDHLERIVTLAIDGDATIAFECLTIVENHELWPDKAVLRCISLLERPASVQHDAHHGIILQDLLSHLRERVGRLPV
jgi:hypothetical protein